MKLKISKVNLFAKLSPIALMFVLLVAPQAPAQNHFYEGKTIALVQASAPGGVGDLRTRAIVPFLQKYIPGHPTVVMEYMPGGGGRKAANHVYRSVRPDGLTIGRMSTPFVMHAMLGEKGVLYDIDKVTFLGTSYSGGYHVFVSRGQAGFDSLEKLRAATSLRIGSQSVGHLIYISGRLFAYLMGVKTPRFVTGYSSPELDVALEKGEIDARSNVADSLLHTNPQWVDTNLMNFHGIIQIPQGRKHRHPRFANLPDIEDFAKSEMDRKVVAMYRTFVGSGNPFILPPGTPNDRVRILQDAMRKTYNDPEFFKEYKKLTGLVAEPQLPEELAQTIKSMPRDAEAVNLFKRITGPEPLPDR